MTRSTANVTVRQVAAHAGVSRQTVSNVLNAPHRVDPATRDRITEAIRTLGYRPNLTARNLSAQRAGMIGYCLQVQRSPSSMMDRFLHELTAQVERQGRHVLLFTAPDGQGGLDVYSDLVAQRAVDGFVLADAVDGDPRPGHLVDLGVPFATFGRVRPRGRQPGPWVDLDGAGACARLVHALASAGHDRIGFLGWAAASAAMADRLRGWRTACKELGLTAGANLIALVEQDSVEAGRTAARQLLDRAKPPTAIVAVSDVVAVGALRELRHRGLVPGVDVAVTGFDDSPLASVVEGGLTTVAQPVRRIASTLVDLLDEGGGTGGGVLLPGEIVVRGSARLDLSEESEN